MRGLFERSELGFALAWIVVYVVGFGNAGVLTDSETTNYAIQVTVGAVMVVALVCFASRNGLLEYWGLRPFRGDWRRFLWFVPLLVAMSENLWLGVGLRAGDIPTTVLGVLAIGVMAPILEELVLRSILYRALGRDDALRAFVICAVTFGVGHISNLLFGADRLYTLIQVGFALCIGFCLMAVLHTGRSLFPCMLAHIEMNALSFFGHTSDSYGAPEFTCIIVMCAICVAYGIYLLRSFAKERPLTNSPLEG